jgi:two-component system CheB/CheR fusion protein
VAIGASAGGLEALRELLQALEDRPPIAFVVVQHLDPDHQSLMADLLARDTALTVQQIEDGMAVEPAHLYVIPPNRALTLNGARLQLREPASPRGRRMPIDEFFVSVAREARQKAIGIVLSGTGSDGTLGLREIKARGGLALVQQPDSARYDGMPRSAIATAQPDVVAPAPQLPAVLLRYVQHDYVLNGEAVAQQKEGQQGDTLAQILHVLRTRTKYDFRGYKRASVLRRIHRRLGLTRVSTLEEYLDWLRERPEEAETLVKDLLIGVTSFFREPESWQALRERVLEMVVREHPEDRPLRCWVPGCATGEEAYSLAFLLEEVFASQQREPHYTIFATDLDRDALEVARTALYPEGVTADVGAELTQRYFRPEGDRLRVHKAVREHLVFAPHNLVGDPSFSHLSLISCRNLLIYLEVELQSRVLAMFSFALEPGGYLALGSSETVTRQGDLFQPVSRKWRIYRRVGRTRAPAAHWPLTDQPSAHRTEPTPARRAGPPHYAQAAERLLLDQFVPPSVVVDSAYRVRYFYGDTGRFLAQPRGEPTADLLELVKRPLRLKVRAALYQSLQQDRRVALDAGPMTPDESESPHLVRVTVSPLPTTVQEEEPLRLVTFATQPAAAGITGQTARPADRDEVTDRDRDKEADQEADEESRAADVEQLEQELLQTREELQATVEEMETSNEELRASNEEVMSMNEELQASNEELETSREELQSLNEELLTVNSQLESKVAELEETTNDLENLLASTNIATLFLDREMRIRRFTPAATHVLRLIPGDHGRPVSDIAPRYGDHDLESRARQVLEDLPPAQQEVHTDDGRWYLQRLQPYRTGEDRIDGVVVTFTDITERHESEQRVRELNRELEQTLATSSTILQVAPVGIFVAHDREAFTVSANTAGRAMLGLLPDGPVLPSEDGVSHNVSLVGEEGQDLPFRFLRDGEELPPEALPIRQAALRGEPVGEAELEVERGIGNRITVRASARPLRDPDGSIFGAVSVLSDVTADRRREIALHDSHSELLEKTEFMRQVATRRDEFLALLGHELRNPLASIRYVAHLLRREQAALPEGARRHVDILDRQSVQLARLVDDLLDVNRIRHGRIELEDEPVSLERVIQTALEATASRLAEGGQTLETDIADPAWVRGDEVRLVQVLQNLLVNSLQHTGAGDTIRVRLTRDSAQGEPGERARLEVSDTGAGIAADRLPTIFDTFSGSKRGEGSTAGGGLGLGLTLVKRLVELHGGQVEARSAGSNAGSTFIIRLPRTEPPTHETARERGGPEGHEPSGSHDPHYPSSTPPAASTAHRVLVVDDEPDLAQSLAEIIAELGGETRTAADGAAALQIIERWPPDLVLLDVGLPDTSGVQVARAIRDLALEAPPKVVALTGFAKDPQANRNADAEADSPFDHWLLKPVDLDTLERLITSLEME